MSLSTHAKGALITIAGVLAITPDSLLIRLISADQWTTLFWRGLLPGIIILVGYALIYRKSFPARVRAIGQPGLWISIVFGIGSVTFVIAISHTTVANVLFIISTSPLFSALISRFVLHDEIHSRTWFAIAVAMSGIGIIAWGSFNGMQGSNLMGDLSALGAAICMSITLTTIHHYRDRDMVPAMGGANIVTALVVLPFAAPFSISGQDLLWIALMGGIVIPLSLTLLTIGPRYLPAPEVGLFLLLEAVIGPYWVWLVIHEEPGSMALIGGTVVLSTLAILNVVELVPSLKRRKAPSLIDTTTDTAGDTPS